QLGCLRGLPCLVLRDVAYQHIGIQADHRADAPRFAIARFMSSIDTVLAALPNMPLSSVTDRLAAINRYWPGSICTNSTRSPASTASAWRTSAGMVIWPLVVMVAVVIYRSSSPGTLTLP